MKVKIHLVDGTKTPTTSRYTCVPNCHIMDPNGHKSEVYLSCMVHIRSH